MRRVSRGLSFRDLLDRHWNGPKGDPDIYKLNRMIEAMDSAMDVADALDQDVPAAVWDTTHAVSKTWRELVDAVADPEAGKEA